MAFFETAFDEAFPEAYRAAIEETGLFTVSRPENVDIKSMSKEEGIELTVDVYTKPEVVLGDYKGIELEITKTEVTDEDVEKELGNRA
ncbi:MAG: trigger factor family protein, partial [Christensenellaceae bacterium]|nr:trigger factor family protein [Christensenellaceae bacterium]